MNRESLKRDIAIVGISCKFPKSNDSKEFWENLIEANEMVQFYTDEEIKELGIDKKIVEDANFIKRKSAIENSNSFDYPFFGYTKDEANLMDPQIRILHEQVWLAIEDAGYDVFNYNDKIGMYLTAEDNFNWIAHSLITENKNIDPYFLSLISNKNFISSLISYKLNLRGPSMAVDTACSSSLVTTHLACRSLLLRECSMAIAGGVNLKTNNIPGYYFREGMINSKDGYCKPFDSDSSGTTRAEGAGVVVLKRLEDAINDRDNIYAVIRASAVNNDGNLKVGYTAPSIKGQVECITSAHKMAKTPYNTISYVECHGTGTKLGDPVEIDALNQAFNNDKSHKCSVGSLKANIGHLGNSAGIGGLIKTTLSLKHKAIPPLKYFTNPNPEINFSGGPFYASSKKEKWESTDPAVPLRAGLSSFGIGGTNAHMIIEEYQDETDSTNSRPFQLITYSAKNEKAVNRYRTKIESFLKDEKSQLSDFSYTMNTGRSEFGYRNYIVEKDSEEEVRTQGIHVTNVSEKQQLVFMFPGQGSQYFRMGKGLYKHEAEFKSTMDLGFKILFDLTGKQYAEIIGYKTCSDVDPNLIHETINTQPVLFLIEYALASMLIKWGVKPENMIGHSLGEYVAACIAGVFSLEDALYLIVNRAQLMYSIEKGSMIAIDSPIENIKDLLNDTLSIAAINSKTTCVISGTIEDVALFGELLTEKEISFSKLKTSHAFHSAMMDSMLEEYKEKFSNVKLSNPALPFVSNLTGKQIKNDEATSPVYWVNHLRQTVNFNDGIDLILQKGNSILVEVGPGTTLLSLSKQNSNYSKKNTAIETLRRFNEEADDNLKFTNAIGNLWSQGIKINWAEYYAHEKRKKISVPTYSFDTYKLDFKVDPFSKMGHNTTSSFEEWFYVPNWKKSILKKENQNAVQNNTFLIFSDENILVTNLIKALRNDGYKVLEIKKGSSFEIINENELKINPFNEEDYKSIFKNLEQNNLQVNQIVFNWDFNEISQENLLSVFSIINNLAKRVQDYLPETKKKITVLNSLNHQIIGDEIINVTMAASMKQLHVFSQENANIFSNSIDVDQANGDTQLVSKITEELLYNYSDTTVAYRGKNRWLEFYERISYNPENKQLKENKTFLITGGLGSVGKTIATHLADNYNATVILIGRKNVPSESLWENILADSNADSNTIGLIRTLQDLKQNNRQIHYYQSDISSLSQLNHVVQKIETDYGDISGVFHTAGNIDPSTFKPVEKLSEEIALNQFLPKVQGTINIQNVFKTRNLDFVWITSSLASILGGLTYGAYAVSNAFIDAFVKSQISEQNNWYSVNLDGIGENRINHKNLIEIVEKTLRTESYPQVVVSLKDPNLFELTKETITEVSEATEDSFLERNELGVEYLAPSNEIESQLCALFQSFLGYKEIGVLDNFFDLGADSLKAMTLMKRMNKVFAIELNILDIFTNPTVKKLAEKIELDIMMTTMQEKAKGQNSIII
ncbi:type I polyketide synthase [Flavobacterium branchiicola]|uniref:SDR family NAD(P)-dependent oxidoreductase n=1 Tax=Flavobacterium branchiicola TaxID=1114875 RepID=A0ABV9PIA5_9FLAO|nr:type I polyketide synthase [Flavobacterium branchiicola]MBS7256342.1 SDR family NAD(P)-dependent oxidoreductase [Flavobacterium branchiicola]